jgi:hypothetical protein
MGAAEDSHGRGQQRAALKTSEEWQTPESVKESQAAAGLSVAPSGARTWVEAVVPGRACPTAVPRLGLLCLPPVCREAGVQVSGS